VFVVADIMGGNSASEAAPAARPEIVLMRGHRVIVDNGVDTAVLARVLAVLDRP